MTPPAKNTKGAKPPSSKTKINPKAIAYVEGMDGQVELLPDRVIIHRRGLLNMFKHGINARREIPLASISSVNFRDATMFKMGEIDFDYAGRSQKDEKINKVQFNGKKHKQFYALKEKIFEMMNQGRK